MGEKWEFLGVLYQVYWFPSMIASVFLKEWEFLVTKVVDFGDQKLVLVIMIINYLSCHLWSECNSHDAIPKNVNKLEICTWKFSWEKKMVGEILSYLENEESLEKYS